MGKVLFLTTIDFWESTSTGGKMISKRNYDMLTKSYGSDSVYYLGVGCSMGIYKDKNRYSVPFKKKNIPMYYNYLFNRYNYGKKEEERIIQYVNKLDPDIIFFDGTWIGGLLLKFQNKSLKATLVYYHNVESNVYYKHIFNSGKIKPQRYIRYKCVKYNEKIVTENADFRICMNERDNKVLDAFFRKQADYFMPTTISDVYKNKFSGESGDERIILLVGTYFVPTINGLDWFLEKVLPYIDCKLVVVGRGMKKYSSPNITEKIEIIGEVEDLSIYYEKADAVICPIFIGDGMKTKTAEAMMYGKTIFATDEALEGYEVEHIKEIHRCNLPSEFIESITDYFNNENRNRYNEAVRSCFLEKYEFNAKFQGFQEWLKENAFLGRV